VRAGETLILCYHRVAEDTEDPFWLCVSPDRFRAHLEELSRVAVPSTLDEIGLPSARPRVVVTLDDGYADNLWNALPVAREVGVPITVFVTSGKLDDASGFWWDRLAAILRGRPPGLDTITLDIGDHGVPVRLAGGPAEERNAVRSELLRLGTSEIDRVLDRLAEGWGVPADAPGDARPLTSPELLELAAADVTSIGAHTIDHVRLHGRTAAEQSATIDGSRKALESLIDHEVVHFAYPFGGRDEFDDTSVAETSRSGFRTACTTLPGSATPTSDPLRLPRRLVMNWSRTRFRVQLLPWSQRRQRE
jgi:peptidoglycan/xylan/chitin deacetylase (PgdA/CDA1 family)